MYPTNAAEFVKMVNVAEKHGWKYHSISNRRTYLYRENRFGTTYVIVVMWPKQW